MFSVPSARRSECHDSERGLRPGEYAFLKREEQGQMSGWVSDAQGKQVGVLVPIELWHEIESERETAYLLKSPAMRKRILEGLERQECYSLEEVRAKLGI